MLFGETLCFLINTSGIVTNYSMTVKGGNCADRAMSDFTINQFDFGVQEWKQIRVMSGYFNEYLDSNNSPIEVFSFKAKRGISFYKMHNQLLNFQKADFIQ